MALLLGLVPAGCVDLPPEALGGSSQSTSEQDRELVALVPDDRARESLLRAARSEGYVVLAENELPGLGFTLVSIEVPEGSGAQAIDDLEAAEPASTVGINLTYRLQQRAGPGAKFNYANMLLDWPAGGCRALAPVGLIDTGVDTTAKALAAAEVINRRFAKGPARQFRHGTEVASVLADPARLRGAKIYVADVIGETREGSEAADAATLIRALDWLADEDVRVVNLSLAGPYNKVLNVAVNAAAERGLILIAAVGNAGPDAPPQYPAGFAPVIAVTAVDASRRIYRGAVRGSHVDVAAPGVDVFVAFGETGRFVTGTSIAAPFITARVLADADLLASPNAMALREKLAEKTEDLGPLGIDPSFGAGLLKAEGLCGVDTG